MVTESLRFNVQTLKPFILKRRDSRWVLSGRGWEAANLQRFGWGESGGWSPAPITLHLHLGNIPFPSRGAVLPRVTSGDRRDPGQAGSLCFREKLTRASWSRAREVTHGNGPASSLLRPNSLRKNPLMLRQPESSSRSCRCRSSPPGRGRDWRATSHHHSATLDLQ